MHIRSSSFLFLCFILCSTHLFALGRTDSPEKAQTVTVYTYDSFAADWGAGPEIARRFQQKTGYTLEYVICEDTAAILSKAKLEKKQPKADVLLGIDTFTAQQVHEADVLEAYRSPHFSNKMEETFRITGGGILTPYDWGFFTVMYDSASSVPEPESLKDLTNPHYKNALAVMDPSMSSPGLGFAAWTKAVYGDDCANYWKKLKPSILTMPHSWSAGYGLFTAGEVPLVISYTTSMAYHIRNDNTNRYKALIFPEGHIMTIEGMGLVKNAPNKKGGQAFIDFMLTKEAQEVLPEKQWMYPVLETVPLPESFKRVPVPEKRLTIPQEQVQEAVQTVLSTMKH